eukprot:CAMPEP_0172491912 /NCGR_PEP_ID=MMETSP1066-20121228/22836_1 /TAXON_ID=671091 /ORGANISM="Coscinodiscus wailesii, Strain CCMP2513" /LENGTH=391 /DNA_ID=CAMNT_0013261215 /DNA_START=77 /DNA_END=1252 /DNA_ORIENTATION=+
MKLTSTFIAVTLCTGAASSFGLNASPKSALQNVRQNLAFVRKTGGAAMVQPVGIDGKIQSPMTTALSAEAASSDALKVKGGGFGLDIPLLLYFAFWYVGNYYYNITNKLALKAAGGSAGFPMTISGLQLGIGCLYGIFLWIAPDARASPKVTLDDIIKMLPVAFCFMGAHSASVFALSAGAVSFGQIVKSAEPAFAAVLSQFVYGKKISKAKWLCLPIVIGGVILASVKELDFAWSALISACIANMFAAVKGNENKKLMETEGLKERIGSVGNQFALTSILAFLMSLPVMIAKEGSKFGQFIDIWKTNPAISYNLIASGLWFYGYNELSTMTLKKTNAVTQSVANTAKRVIVIVGVAIVLGESLDPIKLIGCSIGIGGVLLYSIIDNFVKS